MKNLEYDIPEPLWRDVSTTLVIVGKKTYMFRVCANEICWTFENLDEGGNQRPEYRRVGLLYIKDLVEVVPKFDGGSKPQANI